MAGHEERIVTEDERRKRRLRFVRWRPQPAAIRPRDLITALHNRAGGDPEG